MKELTKITFYILTFMMMLVLMSCAKEDVNVKLDGVDVTIPRVLLKDGKITMFVSVTDLKGNVINDLNHANLKVEVIKDGQVTAISGYSLQSTTSTPTPIATAITMDYSGSMYWDTVSIPAMESAVKTFISLKGLTDQVEIIKFGSTVHVVQAFTTDTLLLYAAVDSTLVVQGFTSFYDACLVGVNDAYNSVSSTVGVLPAVIGFTDGVDNMSTTNVNFLIYHALQHQIPLYTVGYGANNYVDSTTLRIIADTTGGRYYYAPNSSDIQQLYQYINGQLTNTMVIGFPWGNKANATIRVTVSYKGYTDRAEKMIFY